MATKVQWGQEPFTCSNITVGAAILTDTALLAIGIIAVIGLLYPACPVAAFGNMLTIQGALGSLIAGAVLLTALSCRPFCFADRKNENADLVKGENPSRSILPSNPVREVEKIHSSASKTKYYAVKGERFDPGRFMKFYKLFSKLSGIQFEAILEMKDKKITDPSSGNVILFDFWGRAGGEFSNPLPPNSKAFIFYVVVTPNIPSTLTEGCALIYDPDSAIEKIEGIDSLKTALEFQASMRKA